MNNKLIEYGQDVLVMVMNHLVLTVLAVCVEGIFKMDSPQFLLWAAAFILPVGFYVIRSCVRQRVPFLILHLLIPGSVLLLPLTLLYKVSILIFALIYAVLSLRIRYREGAEVDHLMSPLGVVGVIASASLADFFVSHNGWERYYLLIAILYLGLYFISFFLSQYLFLRVVNKSSVGVIPERAIFSTGMKQTLLFSLGSVVLLALTANIGWVSYLLSWIWKGLYPALAAFFAWLPKGETGGVEEDVAKPDMSNPALPDMGEQTENPLLAKILDILEMIVVVAIVIAIIVVVVRFVEKGIKYLRNHFYLFGRKEETETEDVTDIRESCTIEKTRRESTSWFSSRNPRERVRKLFRKQVLKHKDSIIGKRSVDNLGCLTAKECCRKFPVAYAYSDVLAKVYEKARYSEEEITGEEVKRVKAAVK